MCAIWTKRLLAGGILAPHLGLAASLHVAPVSLRIPPGQMATAITLENQGEQPLIAQIRLFAWDQNLGGELLQLQDQLQVSPPMARLAPHSSQVARVMRMGIGTGQKELTYRLLIDELPDPASSADHSIEIRLRYSVPLFILPNTSPRGAALTWYFGRSGGHPYVAVDNAGDLHAQISAVEIQDDAGKALPVATGLLGYALAGHQRQWMLPDHPVSRDWAPIRIKAIVNQQAIVALLHPSSD